MAERYRVAETDDLADEGSRIVTEVEGREVAVFRYDDDFHAVANYCVHQGGPLCEGELQGAVGLGEDGWSWTYGEEGRYVACPWHGWLFDVTTGESQVKSEYAVPTYDVAVEDGEVYVVL